MTDAPTPDDPTAGEEFAPFDDTELLADLTSEMSRPRPLAGEEAGGPLGDDVLLGDAAAVAAAEADVADDVAALLAYTLSLHDALPIYRKSVV